MKPGWVLALVLVASLPAEGVGKETWEDPSAGPFNEQTDDLWALFVLNLNDLRCGAPLGNADLGYALQLRAHLLAQGVDPSRIRILLDGGSGSYGMASEQNVKQWITATALEANEEPEARVLLVFSAHALPYHPPLANWKFARVSGSWMCLNGYPLLSELADYELGTYLSNFAPHVEVGMVFSCSLCGGFADRWYGPVDTVDSAAVARPNRVVATGCGMATECLYDGPPPSAPMPTLTTNTGSPFLRLLLAGLATGEADGWTGVLGDAMLPYDSQRRDGRITLEEAYWRALDRSLVDTRPWPGFAAGSRFQLRDELPGGFVLSTGRPASHTGDPTGSCTADLRDYDEDGEPNAVDPLNDLAQSRATYARGGWVSTFHPMTTSAPLVVVAPSGKQAVFSTFSTNVSLDVFVGEPVDGTWLFDQRRLGPLNTLRAVHLNGKTLDADGQVGPTDLGVVLWNWHADTRTDESVVLDVDPCAASGLRLYVQGATAPV